MVLVRHDDRGQLVVADTDRVQEATQRRRRQSCIDEDACPLGADEKSVPLTAAAETEHFHVSVSEQRATDPNERRSFLDSDVEIVRHAHGKLRERVLETFLELIAQLPQCAEDWPDKFAFWYERCDRHQAANVQMWFREPQSEKFSSLSRSTTVFLFLAGDIHLNQDRKAAANARSSFVQFLDESCTVNGMDQSEELDGMSNLVGLQIADEMKLRIRWKRVFTELSLCLLNAVFPEKA
jgi:hypothetical protein